MPKLRLSRAVLLALLVSIAVALAVPALASAESYQVDTTVDEEDENPGDGICETEAEDCTLRAAIVEVNLGADATNTISFDSSVFNGGESDTIFLAAPLQSIQAPVTIDAKSTCTTAGVVGAPCAGVTGISGEPVFAVQENDVTIIGFAITAGSIGIYVFEESIGFTATGNWIGIPMSGTNSGNASAGIFLGPGSDEAQIGGTAAVDRNVIAHNEVGLDIEGASDATVQGNWFGQPGGGLDPEPADTNIEITDYKPLVGDEDKAEDNEIGSVIDGGDGASAECDGGCNVISSASTNGIDLEGGGTFASEAPASGPTIIRGNYVGINPTGTGAVGNGDVGILAGAAGQVTVGGELFSESNFFAGGSTGILSEDGEGFEAIGNLVGYSGNGAEMTPPSDSAISVSSAGVSEGATIELNAIRLEEEGTGIEQHYIGATIRGNLISGGEVGISTGEYSIADGSLIEGNQIADTEGTGILLSTPDNKVFGNKVFRTEDVGIEVSASAATISGNVIGGDTAASENEIVDSGANAIIINGVEASRNEVRRNHGNGNGGEGGFLVLRGDDPNGAEHPDILVAAKTEASGNEALPGAKVRVFRKASTDEGELAGFLGEDIADASGNWEVSYAAVPAETLITATQTNTEGGTSDLSTIATTPPDPPPSGCPAVPSACPPPPPVPPDVTKPKVTIKKAPQAKSTATTAKFVFSATEAGSKFKCKLDNKAFANCRSPKTYKKLKPGKHVFKAKATDAAGNVSAVVSRKFTVLE